MVADTQQHPTEWSIEALRGLAAALVVITHYAPLMHVDAGLLKYAYSGVDLFFVISGFVFGPYVFGKRVTWAPYAIRRVFRIYPTYLVALLAYLVLRLLQDQGADHVLKHLLFLQTLESKEIAFYYNPAFWSLPPEVEFYIFLPLLSFLSRWRALFSYLFASAFVLHLAIAYLSPHEITRVDVWFFLAVHLPGLLIEFLIGAAVWKLSQRHVTATNRLLLLTAGVALWLLGALIYDHLGAAGIAENALLRGNSGLLAACSFGLIVYAFVGMIRNPPGCVRSGALFVGNLSYGIYLFHHAPPILLRHLSVQLSDTSFVAACVFLTITTALVVHYSIEAPLRSAGRKIAASLKPHDSYSQRAAVVFGSARSNWANRKSSPVE